MYLNPQTLEKGGPNTSSSSSIRKVSDNIVAPKVMVEKTKNELAHLKANPRPPSAVRGKMGSR